MVTYKEVFTIVVVVIFITGYIGFMTVIGIVATKAKWKSAREQLKNLEARKYKNNPELNKNARVYVSIALSFMLLFVIGLACLTPLLITHYLNYPIPLNLDNNFLAIIFNLFLVFVVIATGILGFFWSRVSKNLK